jgi:hypothetical protein
LPAKKPDILSIFDGRLYDHEKVRETVARNDVLRRAEQRVEKDPWDTDAWLTLVNEARNADIDTCRWCVTRQWLPLYMMVQLRGSIVP